MALMVFRARVVKKTEICNYQLYFITCKSSIRSLFIFLNPSTSNILIPTKDGKKTIIKKRELINHCVMVKIRTSQTKSKVILNKGIIKKTKSRIHIFL